MPKISAGLLMYQVQNGQPRVFLAHPGGPYFRNRQEGFWGIPKGLVEENENYLDAGIREFEEETGISPTGPYHKLPMVRYSSSGKYLYSHAFRGEWDPKQGIQSNTFQMEWPPKSGNMQEFPEIDDARWFSMEEGKVMIHPVQIPLLEFLSNFLDHNHISSDDNL